MASPGCKTGTKGSYQPGLKPLFSTSDGTQFSAMYILAHACTSRYSNNLNATGLGFQLPLAKTVEAPYGL